MRHDRVFSLYCAHSLSIIRLQFRFIKDITIAPVTHSNRRRSRGGGKERRSELPIQTILRLDTKSTVRCCLSASFDGHLLLLPDSPSVTCTRLPEVAAWCRRAFSRNPEYRHFTAKRSSVAARCPPRTCRTHRLSTISCCDPACRGHCSDRSGRW